MSNENTCRIAVIPGDGVGPEIVPAGIKVLDAAAEQFGFRLQYEEFPYGAGYYKQTGAFMPEDALDVLKEFDALYFGAVGLPDVDDASGKTVYVQGPDRLRSVCELSSRKTLAGD